MKAGTWVWGNMGMFAERFVEKPRHKGRSYWGGVQARLVFSPLPPATLPLLTKCRNQPPSTAYDCQLGVIVQHLKGE
jgi:hypothetical protein